MCLSVLCFIASNVVSVNAVSRISPFLCARIPPPRCQLLLLFYPQCVFVCLWSACVCPTHRHHCRIYSIFPYPYLRRCCRTVPPRWICWCLWDSSKRPCPCHILPFGTSVTCQIEVLQRQFRLKHIIFESSRESRRFLAHAFVCLFA